MLAIRLEHVAMELDEDPARHRQLAVGAERDERPQRPQPVAA